MTERILYIDPIGGLAGDMLCAALIDAGLDEEQWRNALEGLSWNENAHITCNRVIRGVFAATHVSIHPPSQEKTNTTPVPSTGHGHHHTHGHHSHTHGHLSPHISPQSSIVSGPKPVP